MDKNICEQCTELQKHVDELEHCVNEMPRVNEMAITAAFKLGMQVKEEETVLNRQYYLYATCFCIFLGLANLVVLLIGIFS